MRICADCQRFQNDTCTEDGTFATPGGTCDRWKYRYEPLVFAVRRMRRAQTAKGPTMSQAHARSMSTTCFVRLKKREN